MNLADLSNINAGMLLNQLYPDLMNEWTVRYAGTFYRNYSNDAISIDEKARQVTLARDGFLRLLPSGLLSDENELRSGSFKARFAQLRERLLLLQEQFIPIDSFAFRRELHLERQVSEMLESKETFILRTWFDIDPESLPDPLTRELAHLLPYFKNLRGNTVFVRELLESLLGKPVRLTCGCWSERDSTRERIPWLRYDIIQDGMDKESYLQESAALQPFADFVREWLLPAEARCEIAYKSFSKGKGPQILNYNSTIA